MDGSLAQGLLKRGRSLSESPSMTPTNDNLLRQRNHSVAKSLYRQLRSEGFTHQQIIELSSSLLDLVTEELRTQGCVEAR